MYGIPNMKLSKSLVNRRIRLLEGSGIVFMTNTNIGVDLESEKLLQSFDAVLVATGSTIPRDLEIPGRDSKNIYFAMDFLTQNTKSLLNSSLTDDNYINAKDKNVIVIGGGDTGTDCIATAIRHGCKSLINIELLDQSPIERDSINPWPLWPLIHRTDYGHEEAIKRFGDDPREYATLSQEFTFDNKHNVTGLKTNEVEWEKNNGNFKMNIVEGKTKYWEADLVFLALGFIGPDQKVIKEMGINLDERGNISATHGSFETNKEGIFAAGDCRRGQSLVVWAMNEGRGAALSIDRYLQGTSSLSAPTIKLGSEDN